MRSQGRVGLAATADLINRVADTPQGTQQPVGKHLIIFSDQDAHG
jgi:hypothetical protein